jgi:hypothetical protein
MNTMIFVVEKPRRPQYLAVCQCGLSVNRLYGFERFILQNAPF